MAYNSPYPGLDQMDPRKTYNLDNTSELPKQTVSWKEKFGNGKTPTEWGKCNMNFFSKVWREDSIRRRQKIINYRLVNGEFTFSDYGKDRLSAQINYEENTLGELPKELIHYPICVIPLQSLWGEEAERPFNFRAKAEDSSNTNEYLRAKTDLIHQFMQQSIAQEIQAKLAQMGITSDNPEYQQQAQALTPPQIEQYMRRDFATADEVTANAILFKYIPKLSLTEVFQKGWVDATIVAEEHYWTGTVNDEAVVECVNPVNISYDKSYDIVYLDQAEWVIRGELMAPSSVIDRFRKYLTPDQMEKISVGDVYDSNPSAYNSPTSFVDYGGFSFMPYNGPFGDMDSIRYPLVPGDNVTEYINSGYNPGYPGVWNSRFRKHILVLYAEWMSKRKLGELTYFDENDEPQTIYVDGEFNLNDPLYKDLKDAGASITYTYVNEAWQGVKIGDKIYCQIQPKAFQHKSINKIYGAKLGFTGMIYNNRNATPTSPLDQMKPYQELYNEIMDKVKDLINSDMGNLVVFDLSQVPSQLGWSFQKFLYFIEKKHMLPVNTSQEGASKTFNQWTVLQTSVLNFIDKNISLLEYLENMCNKIAGFTPQRLGDIKATETATGTNMAVSKSYAQTEHYFRLHDNLKARVLTNLLEEVKFNLEEGHEDTYFLDDLSQAFLKVSEGFKFSDLCVYVSDSRKDLQDIQVARSMVRDALQNGSGLYGAFELGTNENISVLKEKLKEIDAAKSQMEQAQLKLQQEEEQNRVALERERMDREDMNKELDRQKDIYVTELKVEGEAALGAKEIDANMNSIPDYNETAKLALEHSKLSFENAKHTRELNSKKEDYERESKIKDKEGKNKLAVEDKKLQQIREQNANQLTLANKQDALKTKELRFKERELKAKERIEKIKARNKNKPKSK